MQPALIRIVKVGGSLLDLRDLADRLRRWLASQSAATNVLVLGGGRRADFVRARRSELTDGEAHWLAVEAMESNARRLLGTLAEATWLDKLGNARRTHASLAILNPRRFLWYEDASHSSGALPASWHVTSDSIAARAAEMIGAAELVLLKSAPAPAPAIPAHLAAIGYVDPFFPQASRQLPAIRYIDLRAWQCPPTALKATGN